jgi:histidinol dehydrogenase
MEKRAFSLVFVGFYVLSIVGLSLNFHYCGTKLAQVQLQSQEIRACCSEKVEKTAKCCKNQAVTFKVKDHHLGNSSIYVPVSIAFLPSNQQVNTGYTKVVNTDKYAFTLQKPPPNNISKEVLYSVFRI